MWLFMFGTVGLLLPVATYSLLSPQARHALGSRPSWGDKDGNYEYSALYNFVLKSLANEDDPWVKTTLEWWNR
jgi:hypothetical protein